MPFSPEQTKSAFDRVFRFTAQLLSYYAWYAKVRPKVDESSSSPVETLHLRLVEGAIVDGWMINLRRVNEFFSAPPSDGNRGYDDDLRAYDFGFSDVGRFLHKDDMLALHKHVGHSTTAGIDTGTIAVDALPATFAALRRCIAFIEFLQTKSDGPHAEKPEVVQQSATWLIELYAEWYKRAVSEGYPPFEMVDDPQISPK